MLAASLPHSYHPSITLFVYVLFAVIAILYSAAGFGGGSSYLAVLSVSGIQYSLIRPIALLCNIAVVTSALAIHHRAGNLRVRRSLALVILSVPAAFVGGTIRLQERTYFIVLGAALVAAAVAMVFQITVARVRSRAGAQDETADVPAAGREWPTVLAGAGVGLLSGLVGIGGGIFLSPILHLTSWDRPRQIAAATSLFIAANSVAGLAGQLTALSGSSLQGVVTWRLAVLVLAVLLGGQIGSRLTAKTFPPDVIRLITAGVVLFIGVRILVQYS